MVLLVGLLGLGVGWQLATWRAQEVLRLSARALGKEVEELDRELRRTDAAILREGRREHCAQLAGMESRARLPNLRGRIQLLRSLQPAFDRGTDADWLEDDWRAVLRRETQSLGELCPWWVRSRSNPNYRAPGCE